MRYHRKDRSMNNIALPRGSSGDFQPYSANDIQFQDNFSLTPPANSSATLFSGAILLESAEGAGKPVGCRIMACNMDGNDHTAAAQIFLVRKATHTSAKVRYIAHLYSTLALTAGAKALGQTGFFVADTYIPTLGAEGTRIENKTGVASAALADTDGYCFYDIPDLDNAHALLIDGKNLTSTRLNFLYELYT